MLLAGKVALVTGSSRGIGAGIARTLGANGADVAVNYFRNAEAAHQVVADIEAAGSHAVAVQGDVSDAVSAEAMIRTAVKALGDIDVLVCNAIGDTDGIIARRLQRLGVLDQVEAIEHRMVLQLRSTLYCCRLVVPSMVERGHGSIVLIGASGTKAGAAVGMSEIGIAKAAHDQLGRELAGDLAPRGIRVNTVAPGMVPTDANAGEHQAAMIAAVVGRTPLGRITVVDDVARTVLAFASDLTSQVTGAFIPVDGGVTMP